MNHNIDRLHSQNNPTCYICNAPTSFYCNKGNAIYQRCKKCGLIYQNPLPSIQEMKQYADQEYSEGGLYADYVSGRELKYATFRQRVKTIQNFVTTGRLLDVGASCGYFIDVTLEAGFDSYGVEFSEVAIAAASKQARERIMLGDVNEINHAHHNSYDVITAFDILEHTFNPLEFLTQLKQLLKPNGLLVISTPDTEHFLRFLMGTHWPMLQPYQHTYLFSKSSFQLALEKVGLKNLGLTSAKKILTAEYLAKQLRTNNPGLIKIYTLFGKIFPRKIREYPISINIGEFVAYAQKIGT